VFIVCSDMISDQDAYLELVCERDRGTHEDFHIRR